MRMFSVLRGLAMGLLLGRLGVAAVGAVDLTVQPPDAQGWVQLRSAGQSNQVHTLQASTNLLTWSEAAILHDAPVGFTDVMVAERGTRYFRLVSRPRTGADDGKNWVNLPGDSFANEPEPVFSFEDGKIRWIKWALLRDDESRVWFQNSAKYPFHYDYARLRLPAFNGLTRDQFDQQTLFRANQKAVLGAVLIAPGEFGPEFGIQVVGQDAFPREDIERWFHRVRAGLGLPLGARVFYLPTFEQAAVAEQNREWLASRGLEVASADRWLSQDARYSEGWAVGRLVYLPAAQIPAAYADGRLRPTDILLTDAVPAEIPFVAGIITLTPATPNSHVAILARGYGVPFVWFADPRIREELVTWNGREVALRTGDLWSQVRVLDVEGQLTPDLRSALAALKLPAPLKYVAKQSAGFYSTNVQNLVPADARWVGGKAANYGLLRRTIPQNAQPAIALTFDVWDEFLSQTLPGGLTLRAAIAQRLAGHTQPPNVAQLRVDLAAVQRMITDQAVVRSELRAPILAALTNAGFDPNRKIRFRSSTNVEDSEDFTGAGLYDSYSGCLLDDLDDDTTGPSRCDPEERNERGVFRAIQKVYASFYNENAFLERLRRSVKEDEVGMAVLVHHSFPDVDEWANGVATVEYRDSFGSENFEGTLVTQLGAESVSNPDSTARPEVVRFYQFSTFLDVSRTQSSSRVPLGDYVMPWNSSYRQLAQLLIQVTRGYAQLFPAKETFTLDFEYKRMSPGKLDIKQVRPLHAAKTSVPVTTFLLDEPTVWTVQEGEFGEPMAKHRAKCELIVNSDPRRLDAAGLKTSLWRAADLTFRVDTETVRLTNGPASWPEASYRFTEGAAIDRWTWGSGSAKRTFEVRASVLAQTTPPAAPWVTQKDFYHTLSVKHATPQPAFGWEGPGTTLVDDVILVPRPEINARSLEQNRSATNATKTIRVYTQFFWPENPRGPVAGYTAPNIGFVETRLEGLTPNPIVLRSPRSQTYSPGHHNFTETFILEPRLDPGVTVDQVLALEAAQIRQLVVQLGFSDPEIGAFGPDGKFRKL